MCVKGLPLSLCWDWKVNGYFSSNTLLLYHNNTIILKDSWYFPLIFPLSFIAFPSVLVDKMIVCIYQREWIMKFCPVTRRTYLYIATLKKSMRLQINQGRLKNFNKTRNNNKINMPLNVKMIFCKRRIGFKNFNGYYSRKRARRWLDLLTNLVTAVIAQLMLKKLHTLLILVSILKYAWTKCKL